jgi:integrase
MSAVDSTQAAAPSKPTKPYTDFPLYAHAAGVWAKKIRGRVYYFGPWADPDGALKKYLEQKDDLHAGRTPRYNPEAVTVKNLVNTFLNMKQRLVEVGELSPRSWTYYKEACDQLIGAFGKQRLLTDLRAADFSLLRDQLARKYGFHRLGNTVQIIRSVFRYAFETDMVNQPMRFGSEFKKPSKKTLRLHRAKQGPKLFTRDEILHLLNAAGMPMKAMILLGINCGLGNADVGRLPLAALDLEQGWLDFPRPKTGMPRRCALWPETVQAVKEAQAKRPEPKDASHTGLVFITKFGAPWFLDNTPGTPVTRVFYNLLRELHINGRKGIGFYTLRHVFRTVADESKDQVAVDHIMGHARDDMASVYRETISDDRLRAVVDHVRQWLFPPASA